MFAERYISVTLFSRIGPVRNSPSLPFQGKDINSDVSVPFFNTIMACGGTRPEEKLENLSISLISIRVRFLSATCHEITLFIIALLISLENVIDWIKNVVLIGNVYPLIIRQSSEALIK